MANTLFVTCRAGTTVSSTSAATPCQKLKTSFATCRARTINSTWATISCQKLARLFVALPLKRDNFFNATGHTYIHTYLEVAALVFVEEAESACFHQLTNYFQRRLVVPLVHLPHKTVRSIGKVQLILLYVSIALLPSRILTSFIHTRREPFNSCKVLFCFAQSRMNSRVALPTSKLLTSYIRPQHSFRTRPRKFELGKVWSSALLIRVYI